MEHNGLRTQLDSPLFKHLVVEPVLLIVAFFCSFTLAPLFGTRGSNQYNISNPFGAAGFNPANNYTHLLFIIVGTLLLFYVLGRLYFSRYSWIIKLAVVGTLAISHFSLYALDGAPGFTGGPQALDNFHSGEHLAPVQAFMSGSSLYDDIFFLRGAGVDVIFPAAGLVLLGKSIGSFLVTTDVLALTAFLSFALLLACLIRNPLQYSGVLSLFYSSAATNLTQFRDVIVWVFVGLVILFFRAGLKGSYKKWLAILAGISASSALFISIDRGMVLVGAAIILSIVLLPLSSDEKNFFSFEPLTWRRNMVNSLYIWLGLLLGITLPGALIGWTSFKAFVRMTFLEIPAFGGLLVSQPFPNLSSESYVLWAPVFVAIADGWLLLKLYSLEKRNFNRLIPYSLLFVLGVACIKIGSNRIHPTKMASATAVLYLATFLLLAYAIKVIYDNRYQALKLVMPVLSGIVVLGIFSQIDLKKLMHQPINFRDRLAAYKSLPASLDDSWLAPDTKLVRDYIISNTSGQDYIYVFTSDPIYYFLTGRRNPSRFYVSWFADPQPYTDELLADLIATKPRLIVYKENTWMDAPDNIPMEERIPEVSEWILSNYPKSIKIGNAIVLEQ